MREAIYICKFYINQRKVFQGCMPENKTHSYQDIFLCMQANRHKIDFNISTPKIRDNCFAFPATKSKFFEVFQASAKLYGKIMPKLFN